MENIILIYIVIAFAGLVQGASGLGFGLTATAILALFLDIKEVVPLLAMSSLTLNIFILVKLRKSFSLDRIIPLFICCILGVPVGLYILDYMSAEVLRRLLGIILIVAVGQQFMPKSWKNHPWHPFFLGIPCGLISGITNGAIGCGGPPVAAYTVSQNFERKQYSTVIQTTLGTTNLIRFTTMMIMGAYTKETLFISLSSAIAVVIGAVIGLKIMRKLPEKHFQYMIRIILIILAVKFLF